MSTAIAAGMTAEKLLALPENGTDRELLRGELKAKPVTYRNRFHVQAVAKITHLLFQWLERQPADNDGVVTPEEATARGSASLRSACRLTHRTRR